MIPKKVLDSINENPKLTPGAREVMIESIEIGIGLGNPANALLKEKLEIAVKALREIESQDYRGNRPNEHAIAFKALNTLDSL